jgi:hypothetical protein
MTVLPLLRSRSIGRCGRSVLPLRRTWTMRRPGCPRANRVPSLRSSLVLGNEYLMNISMWERQGKKRKKGVSETRLFR